MDNGEVKCNFNGHCSSLLNSFKMLLENRKLCDVILTVGMKQFHVHKVILAISSPYFEAMFTSALQESAQREINLKGTNADTVETLINCMYESSLTITVKNATSVLALAAQWQMEKVVEACGKFITQHLDIENCLEMFIFADVHGCDVLKKATIDLDVSKVDFSGVCQTEAFVNEDAEVFNPATKTWKMISGMSKPQIIPNWHNLLATQGKIVVIGRSIKECNEHSKAVQYYNSQTMNWYILSEIKFEHRYFDIGACCI